jgi:hypothetical protein
MKVLNFVLCFTLFIRNNDLIQLCVFFLEPVHVILDFGDLLLHGGDLGIIVFDLSYTI